jgi:hypothetical protein
LKDATTAKKGSKIIVKHSQERNESDSRAVPHPFHIGTGGVQDYMPQQTNFPIISQSSMSFESLIFPIMPDSWWFGDSDPTAFIRLIREWFRRDGCSESCEPIQPRSWRSTSSTSSGEIKLSSQLNQVITDQTVKPIQIGAIVSPRTCNSPQMGTLLCRHASHDKVSCVLSSSDQSAVEQSCPSANFDDKMYTQIQMEQKQSEGYFIIAYENQSSPALLSFLEIIQKSGLSCRFGYIVESRFVANINIIKKI